MGPEAIRDEIKQFAVQAGFELVGVTHALPLETERDRYREWLDAGRHGEMGWMSAERADRSADPTSVLPDARSVISVALSYWQGPRPADNPSLGKIARYAWGSDYHEELGRRLQHLVSLMAAAFDGNHRYYVDTGPLMDKALARRAGVGWYGKNTNILTERFGSYVMLGEVITTLDVAPDEPLARDCGSCSLCTRACPTQALGPDYSIDARRCISYLTIEHRSAVPIELRPLMADWVFGCDVCQDVCPPTMLPHLSSPAARRDWAAGVRRAVRHTPPAPEPADEVVGTAHRGREARRAVDLRWLLRLSHGEYVEAFRHTAMRRAKVWMLRRNAAIAMGNVGLADAIAPLEDCLRHDDHPVVRGAAAWALGRLAERLHVSVVEALRSAEVEEMDESVREEIRQAMRAAAPSDPGQGELTPARPAPSGSRPLCTLRTVETERLTR